MFKKHRRLGHAGIVDPSVDLLIPDFSKYKMEWAETITKFKILYKFITANSNAIVQHAAHTTDQLTS